jgi:hypothetical protein
MRKITVNVTQEDIDAGKPQQPCFCPVALAINRVLGLTADDEMVYVDRYEVTFWKTRFPIDDDQELEYREVELPQEAIDWIEEYDLGGDGLIVADVSPFTFELEVPECA